MFKPMPSPRGTNYECLYLESNPLAAYDAALEDGDGNPIVDSSLAHKMLSRLSDDMTPSELHKVIAMLEKCGMISSTEAASLISSLTSEGAPDMASDTYKGGAPRVVPVETTGMGAHGSFPAGRTISHATTGLGNFGFVPKANWSRAAEDEFRKIVGGGGK